MVKSMCAVLEERAKKLREDMEPASKRHEEATGLPSRRIST